MLLDLLIPYYGRVDYLIAAVDSVLAQPGDDFRVTVVDDADPRGQARAHLTSLGDPRMRFLRNEHNLGLNRNFQRCVELADAPYSVIMGCDDLLLPGYIASLRSAIGLGGWDLHQPGVQVIGGDGTAIMPLADRVKGWLRPRRTPRVTTGQAAAARLCIGDWLYFPSLCWRTEVLRDVGFRPQHRIALDLELILTVLGEGGRLSVGRDRVFAYRRHTASESSPAALEGMRFHEEAQVYREAAHRFADEGWRLAAVSAALRPTSRAHAVLAAAQLRRRGEAPAARQLLGIAAGR